MNPIRPSRQSSLFRAILCPVDFSEPSRAALAYGAALANRFGGTVTPLFVNDPLLEAAAAAVFHQRSEMLQQTRAELERFAASVGGAGIGKSLVASGEPAREILAASRRLKSDVVVIGTHGLGGFDRLMLGSTVQKVLAQAAVPVLAVPTGESAGAQTAPPAAWPGTRLIVPLDLEGNPAAEAQRAAAVARAFGAGVLLVHVVRPVRAPYWLGDRGDTQNQVHASAANTAIDRVKTSIARHVNATCVIAIGDPAAEIAALAERESPNLVVMTLRDQRGFFGARQGSVAYSVLTQARVAVLALPPLKTSRR
jgi:nucleotide-binding universal stress UspA family protein